MTDADHYPRWLGSEPCIMVHRCLRCNAYWEANHTNKTAAETAAFYLCRYGCDGGHEATWKRTPLNNGWRGER